MRLNAIDFLQIFHCDIFYVNDVYKSTNIKISLPAPETFIILVP